MRRCVVIGDRGMLGSHLVDHIRNAPAASKWNVRGVDLPEVDITDAASVGRLFRSERPDVVINCAAYTDVDGAQTHHEEAFRINAVGPELLARAAKHAGALLVHVSTDFVFDGRKESPYREDDAPNPQSAYGKSKLAGEKAIELVGGEYIIVRTAWLYGPNGRNFVSTIIGLAKEKGHLRVVDDQRGSPTSTGVLSKFIWLLVAAAARGTFHVTGSGSCTWHELAKEAVATAGIDATLEPCKTEEFPRPAPRPANSVLDCTKVEKAVGERIPDWREGLKTYVHQSLE